VSTSVEFGKIYCESFEVQQGSLMCY